MINVLGGGGGANGFQHTFEHIIPAMREWLKDMRAREYQFTDANKDTLAKSVHEELATYDPNTVEQQRDELLIRLLKDKKTKSLIV